MKEKHLLLFWPNAKRVNPALESNVSDLNIISRIEITDVQHNEMQNLLDCLYGEKLAGKSFKIKETGVGNIVIFVLEVASLYAITKVTSGVNNVNQEILNLKTLLRDKSGGGHKIHATEDSIEADDDSILFFNKHIDEVSVKDSCSISFNNWLQQSPGLTERMVRFSDKLKFNVLRGVTEKEIFYKSDIDIICADNMLISLRKRLRLVPSSPKNRCSRAYVTIDGKEDVDLRTVSDCYLPKDLSFKLIEQKFIYNRNSYSAAQKSAISYHCLIHKDSVHIKYLDILGFKPNTNSVDKTILVGLIKKNSNLAEVEECTDLTVGYFNSELLDGKRRSIKRRLYWTYIGFRRVFGRLFGRKKSGQYIEII